MSFSTFLNEGLIKLPPKLKNDTELFFKKVAVAHVLYNLLKGAGDDKDEQQFALKTMLRVANSMGIPLPSARDIGKAGKAKNLSLTFPVADIAQRYLDQVKKKLPTEEGTNIENKLKKLKVIFTVVMVKHPEIHNDQTAVYFDDETEPEILISLPNLELSGNIGDDAALISRRIKNGLGSIEHELSHFIQHHVLALLHLDQVKGEGSDEPSKDDYFTSNIEFDPLVKSAIRDFRVIAEKGRVTGHHGQTRALFDGWAEQNGFLSALKRSSEAKWRKAIKLIWAEYEKRYL
jgi:hypothetical protein